MAKIEADEVKRLKSFGCIKDKRYEDVFNVRVPLGYGRITSETQRMIADAADRFGNGMVCLTTRLSYEIQGVKYENIETLRKFLNEHGLDSGGTGPRIRPVVSCKGTVCQFGLIDTFALAEKIHKKFYLGMHGLILPNKFKIGVGGCPNNCIKPELNDIGIRGNHTVKDGRGVNCYVIYIGGHWGKETGKGILLDAEFMTEDEVIAMIERIVFYYRDNGLKGERFAKTIARLGFKKVQDDLFNNMIE